MKPFKTLAVVTGFVLAAGQASACTVYVGKVLGNGNFVDVDVSGCSQTSNFLAGERTFGEIINRAGRLVNYFRSNDGVYKINNDGDNQASIVVHGRRQTTLVSTVGDYNDTIINQGGRGGSTADIRTEGTGNRTSVTIR
ncbi:hypothetical protein [Pseudogemmobacter bohemicus]|uniref:hypothetical protein n=1 Tax=Pseudogemmobacter bohemicus TaxID=2250708 RepID=UPI000DD32DC1|nr:hypothetical protein [Pseudogemmobacter bohemicus]